MSHKLEYFTFRCRDMKRIMDKDKEFLSNIYGSCLINELELVLERMLAKDHSKQDEIVEISWKNLMYAFKKGQSSPAMTRKLKVILRKELGFTDFNEER